MFKKVLSIMIVSLSLLTFVACESEGPAERAGEKVDEAIEDTGDALEEAGEEVEEATD